MRKSLPARLALAELPELLDLEGTEFGFFTLDERPLSGDLNVGSLADGTGIRIRRIDDARDARRDRRPAPPPAAAVPASELAEDLQRLCQCASVRDVRDRSPDERLDRFDQDKVADPCTAHKILIGVAQALVQIHSRGVVHNNLYPSNIFLNTANEPLVSGFEHAFRVGTAPRSFPANRGDAAPEIAAGARNLGTAVDIFAFGFFVRWFNEKMGEYEPLVIQCTLPNPLHRPTAASLVAFLTHDRFHALLRNDRVVAYRRKFRAVGQPQLGLFRGSDFLVLDQLNPATAIVEDRAKDRFIVKTIVTADSELVCDLV
jgi:hypothetical protein